MITYRDFSKFNPVNAVETSSKINWSVALKKEGVDVIGQSITKNISQVFDEHDEIKLLSKIEDNHRKRYWTTRLNCDWNEYKRARNMSNKLVLKEKKYFKKN